MNEEWKQEFEWDLGKEKINIAKHGITFEEAKTVFSDPKALIEENPYSTPGEDRAVIIGISKTLKILFVVHIEQGEIIRLISARRADKQETKRYFDNLSLGED